MKRRLRIQPAYARRFHHTSGAYDVLGADILDRASGWRDWPDVSEYDAWAEALARAAGRPLVFRDVPRASVSAASGYDRFIHATGCIPTRSRSWHDFFNACIWARLPRAKLALHRAQLSEGLARTTAQRTRKQNWLTHFDECGVVLMSSRGEPLERIASLDWRRVFVDERDAFVKDIRVFCFGHAILEAFREPYVGLMGKALLCHDPGLAGSEPGAIGCGPAELGVDRLDRWLASQLSAAELPRLCALPVLGVPGWHAPNERPSFYEQPAYFRTGPSRRGESTLSCSEQPAAAP